MLKFVSFGHQKKKILHDFDNRSFVPAVVYPERSEEFGGPANDTWYY